MIQWCGERQVRAGTALYEQMRSRHAPSKFPLLSGEIALGLALVALLGFAPATFAQVPPPPQNLTIGFSSLNAAAVPLSGWLTAGIALMLAAVALVALRRRTTRGGRLAGWVLVLTAGTDAGSSHRTARDLRSGGNCRTRYLAQLVGQPSLTECSAVRSCHTANGSRDQHHEPVRADRFDRP